MKLYSRIKCRRWQLMLLSIIILSVILYLILFHQNNNKSSLLKESKIICITTKKNNLIFVSIDDILLASASVTPQYIDIMGEKENKYLYYTQMVCKIDSSYLNRNIKQYIIIENLSTNRKVKVNLNDFYNGDFDKIFIGFGHGSGVNQPIAIYSENNTVFWNSAHKPSNSSMEIIDE